MEGKRYVSCTLAGHTFGNAGIYKLPTSSAAKSLPWLIICLASILENRK